MFGATPYILRGKEKVSTLGPTAERRIGGIGLTVALIGLEQWNEWVCNRHTMLPYIVKHPIDLLDNNQIPTWEHVWKHASPYSVLLESGKDGRYTFLGLQPNEILSGKGDSGIIYDQAGQLSGTLSGTPLQVIQSWLQCYRAPLLSPLKLPTFTGGCIGYLAYDVVRTLEKLPNLAKDDLNLPDYLMMRFDQLWIVDHEEHALYCAVQTWIGEGREHDQLAFSYQKAANQAAHMKQLWDQMYADAAKENHRAEKYGRELQTARLDVDVQAITGVQAAFERDAYIEAVQRIQDYIRKGDVFQVNLSVRQSKPLACKPEVLYEWLRLVNPSPYMGLIRTPAFQLVSGSPELLVQLDGEQVRTRPIAGTRPRGASPQEDLEFASELLSNEKERAEHIMLVDLERNDLGKVSRYGTVRVNDLLTIEKYSHVMHLVSEVTGTLGPELNAFDLIAATFPGGTITGAPKVRTMQIIEELEPVRRGPYTGSIGWIDYSGNMELNIVIRTLIAKDGIGYVQAGAGIVIDSDPDKEYVESVNKAKAIWKSIQYAEQELSSVPKQI